MHLVIGYSYAHGEAGIYVHRAAQRAHTVTFAGSAFVPDAGHAGYLPYVDLAQLVAGLPTPPDLFLWVDSGSYFYIPVGIERLPCPTAAWLIDAWPPGLPQRNQHRLLLPPLFDYLFVAHRGAAPTFAAPRDGLPVHWLPMACDPEIHGEIQSERIYDVGFVGAYDARYPERVRMLDALAARYRMNDFEQRYYLQEMARVYSQSRLVANISHTDQILNMRLFEAPAAGALLLTERSADNGQDTLLADGEQMVTFKGQEELLAKAEYYLTHEAERRRIALAGQAHVLAHHTYDARLATLLGVVAADGARRLAPARAWDAERATDHYLRIHSMCRMLDAVMQVPWRRVKGRNRVTKQARQGYYVTTALLRRIKHEWLGR